MRQIYTSPRSENIDRVVALMAEHGIEASVANRSNYKRDTYQRFSYSQRHDNRDSWAQVWITRADDYTRARTLLNELGIEPVIRHAAALAAERDPAQKQPRNVPGLIRRVLLVLVVIVFAIQMMRYLHWF